MKSSKPRLIKVGDGPVAWPPSTWTTETWDAFVRSSERASYLQTSAWARVKASTGWSSILTGDEAGKRGENQTLGAQLLTRPIPMTPWRFAYAPRNPIATHWGTHTI
jgi:lipid II:glycine glycyltransferase (peptidoglycan interpeptide bridge formation enzyme)